MIGSGLRWFQRCRPRRFAITRPATLVRISESGWHQTPAGLKSSYDNCMGWSQMLCALKVFAEQGTNLREFFY